MMININNPYIHLEMGYSIGNSHKYSIDIPFTNGDIHKQSS